MKALKLTDAKKAFVIKREEEGTPVAEICRKAGVSQGTYFSWKKKHVELMRRCFAGPTAQGMRRERALRWPEKASIGGYCSADLAMPLSRR